MLEDTSDFLDHSHFPLQGLIWTDQTAFVAVYVMVDQMPTFDYWNQGLHCTQREADAVISSSYMASNCSRRAKRTTTTNNFIYLKEREKTNPLIGLLMKLIHLIFRIYMCGANCKRVDIIELLPFN